MFLKSDIINLECEKAQIKGLTSLTKENIIVYNKSETSVNANGFFCTLSNISAISVKLDKGTQIAWLKPLPSTFQYFETKENFSIFQRRRI